MEFSPHDGVLGKDTEALTVCTRHIRQSLLVFALVRHGKVCAIRLLTKRTPGKKKGPMRLTDETHAASQDKESVQRPHLHELSSLLPEANSPAIC